MKMNIPITRVNLTKDDARHLVQNRIGSRQKSEQEIGFKYKYSLEDGLKALIEWRENRLQKECEGEIQL